MSSFSINLLPSKSRGKVSFQNIDYMLCREARKLRKLDDLAIFFYINRVNVLAINNGAVKKFDFILKN